MNNPRGVQPPWRQIGGLLVEGVNAALPFAYDTAGKAVPYAYNLARGIRNSDGLNDEVLATFIDNTTTNNVTTNLTYGAVKNMTHLFATEVMAPLPFFEAYISPYLCFSGNSHVLQVQFMVFSLVMTICSPRALWEEVKTCYMILRAIWGLLSALCHFMYKAILDTFLEEWDETKIGHTTMSFYDSEFVGPPQVSSHKTQSRKPADATSTLEDINTVTVLSYYFSCDKPYDYFSIDDAPGVSIVATGSPPQLSEARTATTSLITSPNYNGSDVDYNATAVLAKTEFVQELAFGSLSYDMNWFPVVAQSTLGPSCGIFILPADIISGIKITMVYKFLVPYDPDKLLLPGPDFSRAALSTISDGTIASRSNDIACKRTISPATGIIPVRSVYLKSSIRGATVVSSPAAFVDIIWKIIRDVLVPYNSDRLLTMDVLGTIKPTPTPSDRYNLSAHPFDKLEFTLPSSLALMHMVALRPHNPLGPEQMNLWNVVNSLPALTSVTDQSNEPDGHQNSAGSDRIPAMTFEDISTALIQAPDPTSNTSPFDFTFQPSALPPIPAIFANYIPPPPAGDDPSPQPIPSIESLFSFAPPAESPQLSTNFTTPDETEQLTSHDPLGGNVRKDGQGNTNVGGAANSDGVAKPTSVLEDALKAAVGDDEITGEGAFERRSTDDDMSVKSNGEDGDDASDSEGPQAEAGEPVDGGERAGSPNPPVSESDAAAAASRSETDLGEDLKPEDEGANETNTPENAGLNETDMPDKHGGSAANEQTAADPVFPGSDAVRSATDIGQQRRIGDPVDSETIAASSATNPESKVPASEPARSDSDPPSAKSSNDNGPAIAPPTPDIQSLADRARARRAQNGDSKAPHSPPDSANTLFVVVVDSNKQPTDGSNGQSNGEDPTSPPPNQASKPNSRWTRASVADANDRTARRRFGGIIGILQQDGRKDGRRSQR